MQNVLTLPSMAIKTKKPLLRRVKKLLENCKIRQETTYQEKIDFLKEESYKFYLKQILNKRHKARVVDFPDFMYWQHITIHQEALNLANSIVDMHEKVYGQRYIEKCYKVCKKQVTSTKWGGNLV